MKRFVAGLLLLVAAAAGGPSLAGDYYGEPSASWSGWLPACDEPSVLARVSEKFAYADARILFTGLSIERFDRIRESAVKAGGPGLIDRRFCHATAWMSDGRKSEAVYLIESGQGFASLGWHVESCLPGFDPYRVHDNWCRSIRP
jgi:hypothetical protein